MWFLFTKRKLKLKEKLGLYFPALYFLLPQSCPLHVTAMAPNVQDCEHSSYLRDQPFVVFVCLSYIILMSCTSFMGKKHTLLPNTAGTENQRGV